MSRDLIVQREKLRSERRFASIAVGTIHQNESPRDAMPLIGAPSCYRGSRWPRGGSRIEDDAPPSVRQSSLPPARSLAGLIPNKAQSHLAALFLGRLVNDLGFYTTCTRNSRLRPFLPLQPRDRSVEPVFSPDRIIRGKRSRKSSHAHRSLRYIRVENKGLIKSQRSTV